MPTKCRRENKFVERFLSAYENCSWADAEIDWLDEKIDGAVEALAVRSDGKTIAIEHTIVEPFLKEKEDFAFFERAFQRIESDGALPVLGRWIRMFIPVGIFRGQRKQSSRDAIVEAIHAWLKTNREFLPEGDSRHSLIIAVPGALPLETTLAMKVVPLPGPGKLHIRRQQMENSLGEVIERALKNKLPKLMQTSADKHILFLERQHMNLLTDRMLEEIEERRPKFPDLERVDEIWIIETAAYDRESFLGFERFVGGYLVGSMYFHGETLLDKFENGVTVLGPGVQST
jgi:hypothetical protein